MSEPVRLAKKLAQQLGCSRREAELYIEGGWVRVAGRVVEEPQARVQDEALELDPRARAQAIEPVTLLLHKPPGVLGVAPGEGRQKQPDAFSLLDAAHLFAGDRSGLRPLRRHFANQHLVTPLETGASGLLVFTQDWRVERKLVEEAARVEHETLVDVRGPVSEDALRHLQRSAVIDGRAMQGPKVSVSRQTDELTGLRMAFKGYWPGQIAQLCEQTGLVLLAVRRIRIGRIALAGLAPGQWRYGLGYERF